jgi:fatty acid desaturase
VANTSPGLPQSAAADAERMVRARRRVAALKGFYIHLAVYALVLAGLAVVNLLSGGSWWVLWVAFGWGIGVLAHGLAVSRRTSQALAQWEERKMQEFMREER